MNPDTNALWEQRFAELQRYVRIYGHARIPATSAIHQELRKWLRYQQTLARTGALPIERWLCFQDIGVLLLGSEERWEMRFVQLLEFQHRFGHCRVPAKWKENVPFGHWVHVQRDFKKKGMLSAERIARLEAVGFEWKSRWKSSGGSAEAHWDEMLGHLRKFVKTHGHADILKGDSTHPKLYGWIIDQREAHNAGRLRADRREKLDALGFVWRSSLGRTKRWDARFAELLQFRERFGHCAVAARWKENVSLGYWVHVQREFRRKGMLSADRIARLDAIGFAWAARPDGKSNDEHWDKMLEHLRRFAQEHGHTEVPRDYSAVPRLPGWVRDQRESYHRGQLRPDRRERLEAIGFAWKDSGRGKAQRWEDRLAELLQFRERFGHCQVPAKWRENVPLGHWVHVQREFRKRGTLSADRIARLEAIGFAWEGSAAEAHTASEHWNRMFAHLLAFQKEHGHTRVPKHAGPEGLGMWALRQRARTRAGALPERRRAALDGIGFECELPRRRHVRHWEQRLAELVALKQRHGDFHRSEEWRKNSGLRTWFYEQQRNLRTGKLGAERRQQFEAAGFTAERSRRRAVRWEQRLAELAALKQRHGDFHSSEDWKKNPGLRTWYNEQRRNLLGGKLSAERKQQFEAAGFSPESFERRAARWERRFAELLAFRQQHGHCHIPAQWSENLQLSGWVSLQRVLKKKGSVQPERMRRLEAAGFEWDGRPGKRRGPGATPP